MKKTFLTFLIFSVLSFAQDLTNWQNYFSFSTINEIVGTTDAFWAATEGGAFYYNKTENSYSTMSIIEGLSSNNLKTLAKDSQGRVWFGTESGIINVYNPEDKSFIKIFDIYNSDKTLKGINQIVVKDQSAYIVTDFGISIINTETFNFGDTYRKFGTFNADIRTYSVFLENEKLLVATEEGIAILKEDATNPSAPESWDSYSVNGNKVYKIIKSNTNYICCTNNGLYSFDGNSFTPFLLNNTTINDISYVNNTLFILTSNKLYSYKTSLTEIKTAESNVIYNKFLVQNENNFLIGTNSGVLVNGDVNNKLLPNGPLSNNIMHIDVDKESNLFAATGIDANGLGAFHLDKTIWKTYNVTNTPGMVSNDIHKIYCAPDGKTYFMSKGNGFTVFENGEFTSFNADNTEMEGIPTNTKFVFPSDIEHDSDNDAWVLLYLAHSRRNIALRRSTGDWYYFQAPFSLISQPKSTTAIEVDRHGTKWFIADNQLYYFNHRGTFQNTSDDIWNKFTRITDKVNCIEIDTRGDLWVGTDDGIYIVSQTNNLGSASLKEITTVSLYDKNILNIEVDALNRKWIVTDETIVLVAQDGSRALETLSKENSPLPSSKINSLAFENKTGILFIATDQGLLSYKTTAVEPNKEFSDLFVYPSPFVIEKGKDNIVNIDGLIKDSEIKILTISGELVREFETPGGRVASWDGKDENGELVGSGVYIVVAYDRDADNVTTTKIAVLRK